MSYDLKSLRLPKLRGRALKAFASALENPVTRAALSPKLRKDAGVDRLRTLRPTAAPSGAPLVPAFPPSPPDARADAAAYPAPAAPDEWVSARTLRAAYDAGRTDPEAVVDAILTQIRGHDDGPRALRAFRQINDDDVRRQAEAATQRLKAGEARGPLDGIPIAIKDEVDMAGYPTTAGTNFLGKAPATADSTVVARLRAAGAVLLGKTNMHEIGINPTGANVHYGITRNPWNPAHDPGGSSSGSAAAVAQGYCPIAIGADGGGSIRIPAAHCGLVGLKATYARVSEHGAAPLCWTVGHIGPLAATVSDVALAYAAIAGPDPAAPETRLQPAPELAPPGENLEGLRFGVYRPWFEHAAPDIVRAADQALGALEARGAQRVDVTVEGLDAMRIAHAIAILAEMAGSMNHFVDEADFSASTRINLAIGRDFSATDLVQAQRIRTEALAEFDRVFQSVDVLITPTTAVTSPRIPVAGDFETWSDLSTTTELMRFVFPGNFVGIPGLSIPVGLDGDGLPIGLQIMGPHWSESVLLRTAFHLEAELGRPLPPQYWPIPLQR